MANRAGVTITRKIHADASHAWEVIAAGDGLDRWLPAEQEHHAELENMFGESYEKTIQGLEQFLNTK